MDTGKVKTISGVGEPGSITWCNGGRKIKELFKTAEASNQLKTFYSDLFNNHIGYIGYSSGNCVGVMPKEDNFIIVFLKMILI